MNDREKLIAEAQRLGQRDWCLSVPDVAKEVLNACADALAAPPVLDREKVRQIVMNALPYTVEVSEPDGPAMYAHRTSRGAWQESGPIADALCEAAKRGELS